MLVLRHTTDYKTNCLATKFYKNVAEFYAGLVRVCYKIYKNYTFLEKVFYIKVI